MGVDSILAALVLRLQRRPGAKLRAKTIDLQKAYKNLPVSLDAFRDSYLMVFEPGFDKPRIFRSKVLVFGARASVGLLPNSRWDLVRWLWIVFALDVLLR